jgi:NAD-dependent dihydropyrimidine dehydrogenase PreA subunit
MTDLLCSQQVWNTVLKIEKAQPGDGDASVNLAHLVRRRDNITGKKEQPAQRYLGPHAGLCVTACPADAIQVMHDASVLWRTSAPTGYMYAGVPHGGVGGTAAV